MVEKPKCTVIERFDGSVIVLGPWSEDHKQEKLEFKNLEDCKLELAKKGWEVNAAFVRKGGKAK